MGIINIEGLVIHANHGVLLEENRLGQKFIISAKLYVDVDEAKKTDDVNKTVNYAKVCDVLEQVATENSYNLIETLAYKLAICVLEEFDLIDSVEITVKKPFAPIKQPLDMVSVTIKEKRYKAYLSLGSNMGDKRYYIDEAIDRLDRDAKTKVLKVASFIETEPYGNVDQDDFLNTAVEISTLHSPRELLQLANGIEKHLGRVRTVHWGPRTIDIDIVLYEDKVIRTEELTIPHKEMHMREFVLRPLCEIAPTIMHPIINKNVYQLYMENKFENK